MLLDSKAGVNTAAKVRIGSRIKLMGWLCGADVGVLKKGAAWMLLILVRVDFPALLGSVTSAAVCVAGWDLITEPSRGHAKL